MSWSIKTTKKDNLIIIFCKCFLRFVLYHWGPVLRCTKVVSTKDIVMMKIDIWWRSYRFFSCSFMTHELCVAVICAHRARFVPRDAEMMERVKVFFLCTDFRWLIECTMHSESKAKFTCGNIWTFFCCLHTMHTINQARESVDISKESFLLF